MELNENISKRDAIALLELIHKSTYCASREDYCRLLHLLRKLIDYEYDISALAHKGSHGEVISYDIINISYPPEWLTLYEANAWHTIDPIHKENFTNYQLSYWADIFKKYGAPKAIKSVADDFGIKDGYVHGVRNIRGNQGSIFCFTGKVVKKESHTEVILELVVPHLHQALTNVLNKSDKLHIELSTREKEVLNWIMQGKNTWDVSMILNISERTIKYHMSNIMKKLDAVNRTHAVAIALRERLIDLE